MSESVDNYLKSIYALSATGESGVSTNALAERMSTKPSSATDMLKKLNDRGLVKHTKYYGVTLTGKGKKAAMQIVRRHRLWELFLVEKLGFAWDEVHDIAEQMEHVESNELVQKLDQYLGYPKYDPHGDPIPDEDGNLPPGRSTIKASDMKENDSGKLVAVVDSSSEFLKYLKSVRLSLGSVLTIGEKFSYDNSVQVTTDNRALNLSETVAANLLIQPIKKK